MPITIRWDSPSRSIIRIHLFESWVWEDLAASFQEITHLLDQGDESVDLLVILDTSYIPGNLLDHFPDMANGPVLTHPKGGHTVIVGANYYVRRLVDLMRQTFTASEPRLHIAATTDEAYQMLIDLHKA